MAKRMILMLIVVTGLLTVLGTVKYRQIQSAIAEGAAFRPPPEAVTTLVATEQTWDESLAAIGTAVAVHGVTLSADLPGIVEHIAFDSGDRVRRGDVLIELDSRQEEAQLKAARAQLSLARLQLQRMRELNSKGVTSQAELDTSQAEFTQAEARVGEIRATIARKTLRAPFAGVLGIRQVDLGQYLDPGDPVVPLQALEPIYIDFSVPQQQVGGLAVDSSVEVSSDALNGVLEGRVTAIDSQVDEATRTIRFQATCDNPGAVLRPGMFVEVRATLGAGTSAVTLPASTISYAPYGNSVFVVEELEGPDGSLYSGVRQQFVKLGPSRGDQVAVTEGIAAGEEVVTSGTFKLHNGTAVVVNNEVQPTNDPDPRPENS